MRAALVVALWIGCVACVRSQSRTCDDGRVCPQDAICDLDHGQCVVPEQITPCNEQEEGAVCEVAARYLGHCDRGVCLPCGDGIVIAGEACDDGNLADRDGCSASCDSNERCGNQVTDDVLDESCDDGNFVDHDGCSSTCKSETPRWTRRTGTPGSRVYASAAFDAARRRVVLYGGYQPSGGALYQPDTWEWTGAWSRATQQPELRFAGAKLAYDPGRARTVSYGGLGLDSMVSGTVFEWDGRSWTEGPVGPQRVEHAIAFDTKRRALVVFGGTTAATALAETWELDSATQAWTQRTTVTTPPKRTRAAMTYDPTREVVVMFGGRDASTPLADVWEYDGTNWRTIGAVGPSPRFDAALAFDPASQRVILFGGSTGSATRNDMWSWDGATWTALAPQELPPIRMGHVLVERDDGLLLYGGSGDAQGASGYLGDTWLYTGARWVEAVQPPSLQFAAAASDDLRDRIVIVGGIPVGGSVSNQTWEMTRDRGRLALTSTATDEPGASEHAATGYDPLHDQLVLFGGNGGPQPDEDRTWTWTGSTWQLHALTTRPPPRWDPAMAWDPISAGLILFGGLVAGVPKNDTWRWDGASWTQLMPATQPEVRTTAPMAFDPIRKQLVMFGGRFYSTPVDTTTWIWNGTDWEARALAIHPPVGGGLVGRLAWNPARRTLVYTTGVIGPIEAWEWDGTKWDRVTVVDAPTTIAGHVMFTALDRSGVTINTANNEQWELRWDAPDSLPSETCAGDDLDGDGLSGCNDPDCWWMCTPLCPPAASCP